MSETTSSGAIPDFSKGKLIESFEISDMRCDLLENCPVAGAEALPKEHRFHYRFCLLMIDSNTKGLEGVLSHEVSMFGTEAISFIDKTGNRTTLSPASSKSTPYDFLRHGLELLGQHNQIFNKLELEAVTESLPKYSIVSVDVNKFSFFQKLRIKRELKNLMDKVNKLEGFVGGYLQMCNQFSANSLKTLRQWDVTNPVLSAYLDYVYGVATYGRAAVLPNEQFPDVYLNAFMARVIGSQFGNLPLAKFCVEYLASVTFDFVSTKNESFTFPLFPMRLTNEGGKQIWAERMMLGSRDFKMFADGEIGAYPAGLFELGLMRGSD